MDTLSRSTIMTITLVILISCLQCRQQNDFLTNTQTFVVFDYYKIDIPIDFSKEDENIWSYDPGRWNCRFNLKRYQAGSNDVKSIFNEFHETIGQEDMSEYEFLGGDSIIASDKIGILLSYRKKIKIQKGYPVSGFTYYTAGIVKSNTELITLSSKSFNYDVNPTLYNIFSSIIRIEMSPELNQNIQSGKFAKPDLSCTQHNVFGTDPDNYGPDDMISMNHADDIGLGDPIPDTGFDGEYLIRKQEGFDSISSDKITNYIYMYSKGEKDCFYIEPALENIKGIDSYSIGKINIVSNCIRTYKCIAVGSSIEDYISAYPKDDIIFTYDNGQIVMQSLSFRMKFILSKSDYIGNQVLGVSEAILSYTDFKPKSRIVEIKLYPEPSYFGKD